MYIFNKIKELILRQSVTVRISLITAGLIIVATPIVVGAFYVQGKFTAQLAQNDGSSQSSSSHSSSSTTQSKNSSSGSSSKSNTSTGTTSSNKSGASSSSQNTQSGTTSSTGSSSSSQPSAPSSGGGSSGTPSSPSGCAKGKRVVTASDVSSRLNSGYAAGTQLYIPDAADPWGGCFPGASSTGIPAGTSLSNYNGSCTVSAANTTIDSKTINCNMTINGSNVTIKNSKINATNLQVNGSLLLVDSEVNFGTDINGNGLTGDNITVLRANMHGGKRQVWCSNCTVQDSYLHDQLTDPSGVTHESAVRIDQNVTLTHNAFLCNAPNVDPDAGCSANQTGYPDFEPVKNVTIKNNFYLATTGGYCSYGGATSGKPYSNDSTNATNIRLLNNVFQRGTAANDRTTISLSDKRRYTCGYYGVTTAFDSSKTGFQYSGNMWDDGLLFANDTSYPYTFFD